MLIYGLLNLQRNAFLCINEILSMVGSETLVLEQRNKHFLYFFFTTVESRYDGISALFRIFISLLFVTKNVRHFGHNSSDWWPVWIILEILKIEGSCSACEWHTHTHTSGILGDLKQKKAPLSTALVFVSEGHLPVVSSFGDGLGVSMSTLTCLQWRSPIHALCVLTSIFQSLHLLILPACSSVGSDQAGQIV